TSSKSSLGSLSIRMTDHSIADDGFKVNPECILAVNAPVLIRVEQDSNLVPEGIDRFRQKKERR
ncbi:MAG: hypothetical protein ACXVBB_23510, partial [Isosphaeraceae bacterium]